MVSKAVGLRSALAAYWSYKRPLAQKIEHYVDIEAAQVP